MGWVMEVIYTYITDHKLINRGFLIGPVCPIYGVGLMLITSLLKEYTNKPLVLFILAITICMVVEYFTSYILEKIFNARWWDYSQHRFNINGRICLETTIPFGIGGLGVMYIINPAITKLLMIPSHKLTIILGSIFLVIFITDIIISFSIVGKLKHYFTKKTGDDTEEVNKRIKDYLKNLSPLAKRLIDSFPDLKERLIKITTKIKTKVKKKKNTNA